MSDHDQTYPPITPYLMVDSGDRAIAWYETAFGATPSERYDHEGKLGHATMRVNGSAFFLSDEFPEYQDRTGTQSPTTLGGTTSTISMAVDDVDAWHARAVEAGATEIRAPNDEFYGRMSKLRDPFGHVWSFTGAKRD